MVWEGEQKLVVPSLRVLQLQRESNEENGDTKKANAVSVLQAGRWIFFRAGGLVGGLNGLRARGNYRPSILIPAMSFNSTYDVQLYLS